MSNFNNDMQQKLAVTIQEACELLSVSRTTIYYEMQMGRLNTFRIGRRRLVQVSEINRWLEKLTES